jgi:hypothetical protein
MASEIAYDALLETRRYISEEMATWLGAYGKRLGLAIPAFYLIAVEQGERADAMRETTSQLATITAELKNVVQGVGSLIEQTVAVRRELTIIRKNTAARRMAPITRLIRWLKPSLVKVRLFF